MANGECSQHRVLFFCKGCWGYAQNQAKRLMQPCKAHGALALSERAIKNRGAIARGRHPEDGSAITQPVNVEANVAIEDILEKAPGGWAFNKRLWKKSTDPDAAGHDRLAPQ